MIHQQWIIKVQEVKVPWLNGQESKPSSLKFSNKSSSLLKLYTMKLAKVEIYA
jgi:hypothetical protein